VDNHLASLRAKLEVDPEHPQYLKTVHGIGYRMELPSPAGHPPSDNFAES
jgi:DNA-binding response OmpR family regulator